MTFRQGGGLVDLLLRRPRRLCGSQLSPTSVALQRRARIPARLLLPLLPACLNKLFCPPIHTHSLCTYSLLFAWPCRPHTVCIWKCTYMCCMTTQSLRDVRGFSVSTCLCPECQKSLGIVLFQCSGAPLGPSVCVSVQYMRLRTACNLIP